MLAIGLLAYIPVIFYTLPRKAKYTILVTVALACVAVAYVYMHDQSIKHRIVPLFGILTGGEQTERATSMRTPIWDTGYEMFKQNWFNGVGPRGFRYVYHEYADDDNFFVQGDRRGQTHPHLVFLEIAVETGLVGIIGFIFFYSAVLRFWWRGRHDSNTVAWTSSLLAATFPFNAHMAFYGSYWSGFMWLLAGCSIAVIVQGGSIRRN